MIPDCQPAAAVGARMLDVWDAHSPQWTRGPWRECSRWVDEHLGRVMHTYRIEFWLLDAPFAVVYRYVPDRKWLLRAPDGTAATEAPAVVPLDELPPAHLLAHVKRGESR